MSAADRLFFAIFPPPAVAARIYALQQDLRIRHGLWGRPVAMDRLHVTLCHVGDYAGLPDQIVARAKQAAERVRTASFDVTFDRALSFTGRPRNRPFVLRSPQGAIGVEVIQRMLGGEMKAFGLGRFVRAYTPHMTLLYDSVQVTEHAIEPVTWTASELRLVHSLLGQTRHITLGSWTLDGIAASPPELAHVG